MPITGRTGSRNYRQRRPFSSSSESDSSGEPEAMRPVTKPPPRPRSRSRSPNHRSHSSQRARSVPGHGHPPYKPTRRLPPSHPPRRRSRSPSRKHRSLQPPHKHSHSSHRSSLSPIPKRRRSRGPSDSDRYHHYDKRYEHESDRQRYHSRDRDNHHPSRNMPSNHHDRWPSNDKYPRERDSDGIRGRDHPLPRDKYSHDHDARGTPPMGNRDIQPHPSSQGSRPISDSEPPNVPKRNHYPDRTTDYHLPKATDPHTEGSSFVQDRAPDVYRRNSPSMRDGKAFSDISDDIHYQRKQSESKIGKELETDYAADRFGQTLDERFKAVAVENNRCLEPRIQYTREDLEKITIDIRRNLREPSPTIRRIINPEEIKVTRRMGEGNRPIFDREEIKMAPVDLREDAFFERRVVAVVRNTDKDGSSSMGIAPGISNSVGPLRETYQDQEGVDKRKFDNFSANTGVTLSERWQGKLDGALSHDKMIQRHNDIDIYEKSIRAPDGYRSEDCLPYSEASEHVMLGEEKHFSRDSLDDRRKDQGYPCHFSRDPNDLRHSLATRRTSSESRMRPTDQHGYHPREKERPLSRDSRGSSWHRELDKRMSDSSLNRYKDSRNMSSRLSHSSGGSYIDDLDLRRDRKRERDSSLRRDKLSDYPPRSSHYKYDLWFKNKPELTPKGPSYYEHDDRSDSGYPLRGRGRGRGLRARSFFGFRGRGTRGFVRARGSFFRGSLGRGFLPSRRGKSSPSHWEHDLFETSSDKYIPPAGFKQGFRGRYKPKEG